MSHVVVIGALPESLLNFRGELLRALVVAGHRVTALAAPASDEVIVELATIGVAFESYPVQRNGMSPVRDLRTFIALRAALKRLRPDVVLAYTIKPVIWGGVALNGLRKIRFFALVTGLGFSFQAEAGVARRMLAVLVSGLYRAALRRAERVIFQNRDNRDVFLARHIVVKDKCGVVNGSGVDLAHFVSVPLPPGPPVFLSIGRLLGEKGFREFAQAAAIVKGRYPDARFVWVGPLDPSPDGIRESELKEWIGQGVIEYPGATRDVRLYLALCHVYVLPSYHEGMPRTILEAMAIGRPILTTNVPGCRETVNSGENGFLVPHANVPALAERLSWFIENSDAWAEMGCKSRELAVRLFDVNSVNREMLGMMGLVDAETNF